MSEVELIELKAGEKYRARSRRDPRIVHKIERDEYGRGWTCQCEAFYFTGHCGHLGALNQWLAAEEFWQVAPKPYDPDRWSSYEEWRAEQ